MERKVHHHHGNWGDRERADYSEIRTEKKIILAVEKNIDWIGVCFFLALLLPVNSTFFKGRCRQ